MYKNLAVKRILALFILLLNVVIAGATTVTDKYEAKIRFHLNGSEIDEDYLDNSDQLAALDEMLASYNREDSTTRLQFNVCGYASPEGSYETNLRLSAERCAILKKYITDRLPNVTPLIIETCDRYIDWDELRDVVDASAIPEKGEILEILSHEEQMVTTNGGNHIDNRINELKELRNGRTWYQLRLWVFPSMRYASIEMESNREVPETESLTPEEVERRVAAELAAREQQNAAADNAETDYEEEDEEHACFRNHLYLKTNGVGWLLLNANAAVELDFARRWSVMLPIYYGAFNYFTGNYKVRLFAMLPELRYWLAGSECNTAHGFFVGVHAGFSYFNVAVGGDTRYQDHAGRKPALGGGVGAGYRIDFGRRKHFALELSVGGGFYHLDYDKFVNVSNGARYGRKQKNMFLLDNVGVTVSYRFNLRRKRMQ
jgi:hypothetical protein